MKSAVHIGAGLMVKALNFAFSGYGFIVDLLIIQVFLAHLTFFVKWEAGRLVRLKSSILLYVEELKNKTAFIHASREQAKLRL